MRITNVIVISCIVNGILSLSQQLRSTKKPKRPLLFLFIINISKNANVSQNIHCCR